MTGLLLLVLAADAPDFQRHVVPLLGRLGCNGRSCHGSFQGQGGFRLSLFGYDFQADHDALAARCAIVLLPGRSGLNEAPEEARPFELEENGAGDAGQARRLATFAEEADGRLLDGPGELGIRQVAVGRAQAQGDDRRGRCLAVASRTGPLPRQVWLQSINPRTEQPP